MKFGPVPAAMAEGAVLAHATRLGDGLLKKGTRLTAADCARLVAAGVEEVIVARLDPGDVAEDAAAAWLAMAVTGPGIAPEPAFTGRTNLFASGPGLFVVDRETVDSFNRVDPAITLATLPAFAPVAAGQMVATVKIIPFAVSGAALEAARAVAAARPLRVAPYVIGRVGVVSTLLPSLKRTTVDKTLDVLARRLAPSGAVIVADERVPHRADAVAAAIGRAKAAGAGLIVLFGASAVVDADDILPAGIRAAGGQVLRFGMPVDPGNLLLLAELDGLPVLGAPGCARSPRENGFDWVLARLLAGLPVTADDIAGLGVGGLLMEIPSRPQPRAEPEPAARGAVAAIVLAAGRSSRMGGPNKLLESFDGKPLVRRAAEAALASRARPVIVVTGHMGDAVAAALDGLDIIRVENPDFAAGLSTSLAAGLGAVPAEAEAAIVLLGDMPAVDGPAIDRVIAAHDPARGAFIVRATSGGRRGNPVLWSRRFFAELSAITGDQGGRALFEAAPEAVVDVEIGPAAGLDVDTPEALAAARALFERA